MNRILPSALTAGQSSAMGRKTLRLQGLSLPWKKKPLQCTKDIGIKQNAPLLGHFIIALK